MKKTYEQLTWEMDVLDEFIEKAYEGLIIIDEKGLIVKFKYEKFLDLKEADVIGKHVTEVIENTRLHIVLQTGEAEMGDVQVIKGHRVVTSRIPIFRSGKVIAVVGTILFKDVLEVKHLAAHLEQMKKSVQEYKQEIKRLNTAKYTFDQILTNDPKMKRVIETAKKASQTSSNVYILGASGTGKEYFAHAIHEASHRHFAPFVRVNCAGIPEQLFESEMFGYEPGAFTGASTHGKMGKFEVANGGTVFLDEMGAMPLALQAKMLRVIEEREIERIGGNKRIPVDVRLIVASNEPLEALAAEGKFRKDLFYRINVLNIELPKLIDRPRDIHLLMHHFLDFFCAKEGKTLEGFSDVAKGCLENYHWPGNVRELRNVIERAVALNKGKAISVSDLPPQIAALNKEVGLRVAIPNLDLHTEGSLKQVVETVETTLILQALENCGGSRTKAAKKLGIHRTALYKKMEKLGIDPMNHQ